MEECITEYFPTVVVLKVVDCRICGDPNSVLRFAFIEFTDEGTLMTFIYRIYHFERCYFSIWTVVINVGGVKFNLLQKVQGML